MQLLLCTRRAQLHGVAVLVYIIIIQYIVVYKYPVHWYTTVVNNNPSGKLESENICMIVYIKYTPMDEILRDYFSILIQLFVIIVLLVLYTQLPQFHCTVVRA